MKQDLDYLERQRCIYFYHWAQEDFKREIEEGYPLVSTIQSRSAHCFISFANELPLSQQMLLGKALVKSAHPEALLYIGETIDDQEKQLCAKKIAYARVYNPTWEKSYMNQDRPSNSITNRKEVISKITTLIPSSSNHAKVHSGKNHCSILIKIDDWHIRTDFELSKRDPIRLDCEHAILAFPQQRVGLVNRPCHKMTNFLTWLGISLTEWFIPYETDTYSALKSVSLIYEHDIAGMRKVLEKLSAID